MAPSCSVLVFAFLELELARLGFLIFKLQNKQDLLLPPNVMGCSAWQILRVQGENCESQFCYEDDMDFLILFVSPIMSFMYSAFL